MSTYSPIYKLLIVKTFHINIFRKTYLVFFVTIFFYSIIITVNDLKNNKFHIYFVMNQFFLKINSHLNI